MRAPRRSRRRPRCTSCARATRWPRSRPASVLPSAAIRRANPQITNPDRIYIGQRITIPRSGGTQPTPAATTPVNIYMIGIGGGSVGCGDQVVPVRRDIPKTTAPLTAALNLLLAQKSQYYGESGLYNALYQSNLRIANITRSGDNWTVSLVGTMQLGGVCDNPQGEGPTGADCAAILYREERTLFHQRHAAGHGPFREVVPLTALPLPS